MYPEYNGFPYWGSPYARKSAAIPGRQVDMMIQDIDINQVPGGSSLQQSRQTLRPLIPVAQGPGTDPSQDVGSFGSNLYDAIMLPSLGPGEDG